MFRKTLMTLVLAGAASVAALGSANAGGYGATYGGGHVVIEYNQPSHSCDYYWDKYVYWKNQFDLYHSWKAEKKMNHWYAKWHSCAH